MIHRYATHRELPPYSYVPGKWPHPISHPDGHWFNQQLVPVVLTSESKWRSCETYLYAVDLFNHGYYWEAHEMWESLWHAAGRKGTRADFFKGLIKLAAAGVKAREGVAQGISRHLSRSRELIRTVIEDASQICNNSSLFWGIQLEEVDRLIERWQSTKVNDEWTASLPVLRVWREPLVLE